MTKKFIFRGDDRYQGGAIGLSLGAAADAADIQSAADHVLRKESSRSSRFVSFTEEMKVARKFTCASDNRYVVRLEVAKLRTMEAQGIVRIWDPDRVYLTLTAETRKLAKQAADVRAAMTRNSAILIEGQISAENFERAN